MAANTLKLRAVVTGLMADFGDLTPEAAAEEGTARWRKRLESGA